VQQKEIDLTYLKEQAKTLKAGDSCLLTGWLYTARDAAHKRLFEMMEKNEKLPIDLEGAVIYYAGPTPARDNQAVGACGPTTSGRMDCFTPKLFSMGLSATVGKGERSPQVIEAMKNYDGLYFCAIGGAGALASACIKSCEVIAFDDLGCESLKRMYVEKFPVIVAIDAQGNNLYREGRLQYQKST
jgi:fumarate hydratase subunit beta